VTEATQIPHRAIAHFRPAWPSADRTAAPSNFLFVGLQLSLVFSFASERIIPSIPLPILSILIAGEAKS